MRPLLTPLRRQFARFWELWVLMLGHGFATLFLSNLAAGLKDIQEPSVHSLALIGHRLFTLGYHLPLRVGVLVLLLAVALLLSRGRSIRLAASASGVPWKSSRQCRRTMLVHEPEGTRIGRSDPSSNAFNVALATERAGPSCPELKAG